MQRLLAVSVEERRSSQVQLAPCLAAHGCGRSGAASGTVFYEGQHRQSPRGGWRRTLRRSVVAMAVGLGVYAGQSTLAVAGGYCGPGRTLHKHAVSDGETVAAIAIDYGVTRKSIAYNNPGLDPNVVSIGQVIKICMPNDSDKLAEITAADKKAKGKKSGKSSKKDKASKPKSGCGRKDTVQIHEVRSGQTVHSIAGKYGVSDTLLISQNPALKRNPNLLKVGQELKVCIPKHQANKSKLCEYRTPLHTHEVIPGDTAARIAGRYGVRRKDLYRLNSRLKRNPNKLSVGQKVRVCPDIAPREIVKLTHSVASGETFDSIAKNYGLTRGELFGFQRGRLKDPNKLHRGDRITIYREGGIVSGFGAYSGHKGKLKAGFQLPSGRHYVVKHPRLSWGTSNTVRTIQQAISSYSRRAKGGPKIHVGDISKKGGGKFPPHLSHQDGRDVDIGYVLTGKQKDEIKFRRANKKNLDVARTWRLLKTFLDTGQVRYIFMDYRLQKLVYKYARDKGVSEDTLDELFQYPRGKGRTHGIVRHWRGHVNHFHIRFR
ncbi:MAG: penicillin-insensitive murein endopeptidase [Nannocystaceae bacterium]